MMEEPYIDVGIIEAYVCVSGALNGPFLINGTLRLDGAFSARTEAGKIILADGKGRTLLREKEVRCAPLESSTFTLSDVTIGVRFHWERKQEQTFRGELIIITDKDDLITAVNRVLLEDYIASVISSEMNPEAPLEFLKAHAIASRSWLLAMLKGKGKVKRSPEAGSAPESHEVIRYYNRVDHERFDVCADDHCQRYQGVTRIASENARNAVTETRGIFLVHGNEICDARYHKACGGLTEDFANTWEDVSVPYLTSVPDSGTPHDPIRTEEEARKWIMAEPDAYCNTHDKDILRRILSDFDRETTDFFRWNVAYARTELEEIIREKSGIDFGDITDIIPVLRGPSGRIVKLMIKGAKKTVTVGKELEIRRWLSRSHLMSSAFIVCKEQDESELPARFIFQGAGWGHGVGLCQIGAAVMALKGFSAPAILKHYFRGADMEKLY